MVKSFIIKRKITTDSNKQNQILLNEQPSPIYLDNYNNPDYDEDEDDISEEMSELTDKSQFIVSDDDEEQYNCSDDEYDDNKESQEIESESAEEEEVNDEQSQNQDESHIQSEVNMDMDEPEDSMEEEMNTSRHNQIPRKSKRIEKKKKQTVHFEEVDEDEDDDEEEEENEIEATTRNNRADQNRIETRQSTGPKRLPIHQEQRFPRRQQRQPTHDECMYCYRHFHIRNMKFHRKCCLRKQISTASSQLMMAYFKYENTIRMLKLNPNEIKSTLNALRNLTSNRLANQADNRGRSNNRRRSSHPQTHADLLSHLVSNPLRMMGNY